MLRLAQFDANPYMRACYLAEQEDLPNKFLESILLSLRRGGFLESKAGSRGGYRLSRQTRQISVGDLIRWLEGRLTIKDKRDLPAGELSGSKIAVRLINERLTDGINKVLDPMTLEQLVEHVTRAAAGNQSMYYI